jgi:hypothetical protein
MSMEAKLALFGGVIPGLFSGVVLLVAWLLHARRQQQTEPDRASRGPVWLAPPLITLAYAFGDYSKNNLPQLWPDSNNHRYVHAVALIGLLGLLTGLVRLPIVAAYPLRAAVMGGAFWMLVEGYHPHAVPSVQFYGWLAASALVGAGIITAAEIGAAHLRRGSAPGVLLIACAGAGPVLLLGNLSYGMHGIVPMIAFCSAALIVGLIVSRFRLDRGGATVITGVILVLAIGAGFQNEVVSMTSLLLLAMSPAALAVAAALKERAWWLRLVAAGAAVAVLVGSSLVTAQIAQPEPDPDDPYAGY